MNRGFYPVGENEVAVFFEDSEVLQENLNEILDQYL